VEQELESAWDAAQQRYTRVDTDLAHFNISLLSALRPSWGDVLERSGGAVTVAGDITRSANALPAVEALLLQLAAPSDP